MNSRFHPLLVLSFSLLVTPVFLLAAGPVDEAGCQQRRAEIANAENQLRQWEDFVAKGGPGVSEADLNRLRDLLRQGKMEFAQKCPDQSPSSGAPSVKKPPQTSHQNPNFPEDNPWGKSGDSLKAIDENPWAQQGQGAAGSRSGDPHAGPHNPPQVENDDPRALPAQGAGGGPGNNGSGNEDNGPTSVSAGGGTPDGSGTSGGTGGTAASGVKDPSLDYTGKGCSYFTKADDDAHVHSYADGAWSCYGGRLYACEDRRWSSRGKCSDWKESPPDASIIEGTASSGPQRGTSPSN